MAQADFITTCRDIRGSGEQPALDESGELIVNGESIWGKIYKLNDETEKAASDGSGSLEAVELIEDNIEAIQVDVTDKHGDVDGWQATVDTQYTAIAGADGTGETDGFHAEVVNRETLMNPHYDAIDAVNANEVNVNKVADNEVNISAVALNETNINEVNTNKANIDSAVANEVNITAVSTNKINIDSVAANETNITAVNANETNINAVNANKSNIDAVADNGSNIESVADNEANVTSVAGNETNINAVNDNKVNIDAVAANRGNIDNVAGNNVNIDAVAGNKVNIDAVAANETDIDTVAVNMTDVKSVADNVVDIVAVAANEDNITAVAGDLVNTQTVADAITDEDSALNTALENADSAEASELKAEQWAEEAEDVQVETDQYSAKHWASKAAQVVGDGIIDDSSPSDSTTYSSTKISEANDALSNTIAGIATAYGTLIDEGTMRPIGTDERPLVFNVDKESNDSSIIELNAPDEKVSLKRDASYSYNSKILVKNMSADDSVTETLTFKIINDADDSVLREVVKEVTLTGGQSKEIQLSPVLEVGRGTIPSTAGGALVITFTVQSNGSGVELLSYNTILAASAPYELAHLRDAEVELVNKTLTDISNEIHANAIHGAVQAVENLIKGDVVVIDSYAEPFTKVKKRSADTEVVVGFCETDIANGETGGVIAIGLIDNIDKYSGNDFPVGSTVYPDTSGGLTLTPDVGHGKVSQAIGYVVKANPAKISLRASATSVHDAASEVSFDDSGLSIAADNLQDAVTVLSQRTTKYVGLFGTLGELEAITGTAGNYGDVDSGAGSEIVRYIWDTDDSTWFEQAGASAALTDEQVKTQYENNANTNAYDDTEKAKLATVEDSATADQTDVEIKTAYENNADTNAYTDDEQTKLGTVEENAKDDQTGAEIKSLYEAEADTNAYDDAAVTEVAKVTDKAEKSQDESTETIYEDSTLTQEYKIYIDNEEITLERIA